MKNIMILVSGMPATGKTTFARWLSPEARAPLVCYDSIKEKTLELMYASCESAEQYGLFGRIPYEFFMFNCEEIMKSRSMLIAEYFFTTQMKDMLDSLTGKYNYTTVTVHMDAAPEIAHRRFLERNRSGAQPEGMRPAEITLEQFTAGTKQNRDFRYGDKIIHVNTDDFSLVSYDGIAERILGDYI